MYFLLRTFDRALSVHGAFLQTLHGREKVLEFFVDIVAALGLFRGRPVVFAEDEDSGDGEEEGFGEGVSTVFDGSGWVGACASAQEGETKGGCNGRVKIKIKSNRKRGRERKEKLVLGLGQGSDVLTCGFAEDVGPEGDFGGMHPLCQGDTDVAKGFMSWCVRACVES